MSGGTGTWHRQQALGGGPGPAPGAPLIAPVAPLRTERLNTARGHHLWRWRSSVTHDLILWHPDIRAWVTPSVVNGGKGWRALTYQPHLLARADEVFIRVGHGPFAPADRRY